MSTGIYSIGVSGITAAQLNLLATEHNVVNASTPGYTRQRAVQATNIAVNTGAGAIGQGVHVQTIERMYDRYLTDQVNSAQTTLSGIDAYYTEIKQIDNLLADPSAGLTPALQDFFSGVQQVASNPALISAREAMVSSATTLVNRFHSLDTRLSEMTDEVNGKIQDAVSSINSYASEIADLNQRIIVSEGTYGQPANDLLDQRDQLINELNKLIKVSTSTNSNGSFNVFIGSGQQLVVGNQAMKLTANAASADQSRIVVGLETAGGGSLELPESLVTGGELGGLVAFRSQTLDKATNELGRIAASVALTFNAQHALGMDLLGNSSDFPPTNPAPTPPLPLNANFNADFFSVGGLVPTVSANVHNTGNLNVSAQLISPPPYEAGAENFYTNLTNSDYRLVLNNGGTYTLTRLSDNKSFPPVTPDLSGNISVSSEGFSISVSGGGVAGDSFLIQPTRNAAKNLLVNQVIAADPRTVAAASLSSRAIAASTNTGSASFSPVSTVHNTNTAWLPITVTYTAATNSLAFSSTNPLASLPAPVPYTSGMSISVLGMTFKIDGALKDSDIFTLSRSTATVADGRNALALGQLQTKNTMLGAKATFQGVYAQLVASNGIKTRELKVTGEAQQAVLNQAQASRDALSGVNLDEEAANMIRYQQAYQASAKLLEVGKTLFDTVLQLG